MLKWVTVSSPGEGQICSSPTHPSLTSTTPPGCTQVLLSVLLQCTVRSEAHPGLASVVVRDLDSTHTVGRRGAKPLLPPLPLMVLLYASAHGRIRRARPARRLHHLGMHLGYGTRARTMPTTQVPPLSHPLRTVVCRDLTRLCLRSCIGVKLRGSAGPAIAYRPKQATNEQCSFQSSLLCLVSRVTYFNEFNVARPSSDVVLVFSFI